MTSPFPRVAYIVSHTHWDREWYFTFEEFRVNLVRVVGRVLDALERDEEFRHFVLDGQAVILEDHLEAKPEDEERIRALVREGKLAVGPWYVLPDEFLVSGEATVRNLLLGHAAASRFGRVQRAGYMPDSFGHLAQMPQILRGAGIDSFIYTRGHGDEIDALGWEYLWRAPDGSEVLAVNPCGGYCNAGGLGFEEIWHAHTRRAVDPARAVRQIHDLFARMAPMANGDLALVMNGCDHFPPQQEFGLVLRSLRAAFPGTTFVHASLEEYVAAVRRAGIATLPFVGELLRGKHHFILTGVWSARMPLKQMNDRAQSLLADYLEPIAAAARFLRGAAWPGGEIEAAWKLLLRNHPHDSICGCSTDAVHRAMVPRFQGVLDTAEHLARRILEEAAPTFARRGAGDRETVLSVMNPLPFPRTEIVTRLVVLQPWGIDPASLRLRDEAGREVPFAIVDVKFVERFWGVDYRTLLFHDQQEERFDVYLERFGARILGTEADRLTRDTFLTIQFEAALPACGHAQFFLEEAEEADPPVAPRVRAAGGGIENEHLAATLHPDGTFDLLDKATGRRYEGLGRLEDEADAGDEYDWCPAAEAEILTSAGLAGEVVKVEAGPLAAALEAHFTWKLPAALRPDRSGRTDARTACAARTRLRLRAGAPWLEVETRFENAARDHRLRVAFPTGVRSRTVVSDGQFLLVERPIRPSGGEGWAQPPLFTHPQQEFSFTRDAGGGLALASHGLPEIEARPDDEGRVTLLLTLLRGVEWLSRDDLATRRRANAGPTLHTPDAQCPGTHRFRYAVIPFGAGETGSGVKRLARRYRVPPAAIQGVKDLREPGGTGLVEIGDPRIAVSAIKRHVRHDTLVLRLWNVTGEIVRDRIRCGRVVAAAWELDLLEARGRSLAPADERSVLVELGPHRIQTVEIAFR